MQEPATTKNQVEQPVPETETKQDYQSPVCEQHKPLDHVRTWQTKSLPS